MWCRAIFHAFASQLWIVIVISSDGSQTLNFCSVPLQFGKDEKYIRCVYVDFFKQLSLMVKTLTPWNPTEPLKEFLSFTVFQNDPWVIQKQLEIWLNILQWWLTLRHDYNYDNPGRTGFLIQVLGFVRRDCEFSDRLTSHRKALMKNVFSCLVQGQHFTPASQRQGSRVEESLCV